MDASKSRVLRITGCAMLVLAMSGCVSIIGDSRPKWLSDPYVQHDQSRYLAAVGEADNREDAQTRALANLAKIFSVSVNEQHVDNTAYSGAAGVKHSVSREISAIASNQISHALIPEFYETDDGRVYAHAILDKAAMAKQLRDQIHQADHQVMALIEYASTAAPNAFSALSALKTARLQQIERESAQRDLLVVAKSGIPTRQSLAKVDSLLKTSLAQLRFNVTGNDAFSVAQMESAIAALGAKTVSGATALNIVVDLALEPVFQKQGWHWQRGSIVLSALENDEAVRQKQWSLKASAQEKGLVRQRIDQSISNAMELYLLELLTSDSTTEK